VIPRCLTLLLLSLLACSTAAAEDPRRAVVTRQELTLDGRKLAYEATIGSLPVPAGRDDKSARGQIFYVAYRLPGDGRKPRPLTFLFNGGPGAASVYLHLGGLGPKRVAFSADGAALPPPARLEANAETWLPLTDLVFVDPVGTGYSRVDPAEKAKEGDDPEKPFLGVSQDLNALAEFIRLWLTRQQRWSSPVFLVGESYGGFRVAELAHKLMTDKGVVPTGIGMISPALDFGLLFGGDRQMGPVLGLPSMAAIAARHGKAGPERPAVELRQQAEDFAVNRLLPALAQGGDLPAATRADLAADLAAMTGMPVDLVLRNDLRLPATLFAKRLLRDDNRLVGRYDGGVTAIDANPGSDGHYANDPSLEPVVATLTAGFNIYVRTDLNYETDVAYDALSGRVNGGWDWRSGMRGPQGYVQAMSSLRDALHLNPTLKVWIVHGAWDLVTPYFGSTYLVRQMRLDPTLRGAVRLDVLPGGHMMYLLDGSRKELRQLADKQLYAAALDR
jgi:carboxypeptidase C (cathepsin A)